MPLTSSPDVLQSVVDIVIRCLQATVGLDAVLAAVDEPRADSQVVVALDVRGDVRGPVTWVFPPDIALELVRRLLADPNPPPESVADGATELANILTGHASEALEAHGFRCEIGVPQVLPAADLPNGLTVRMTTAKGPIDLVLALSR